MRLLVDEACDAACFGLTVRRATSVDDVDASVTAPSVAGAYVTDTLLLKPVREPRDLEPIARVSVQIDE